MPYNPRAKGRGNWFPGGLGKRTQVAVKSTCLIGATAETENNSLRFRGENLEQPVKRAFPAG